MLQLNQARTKPPRSEVGKATSPSGEEVTVTVVIHQRKGWKAPRLVMIHYNGRQITPYEQQLRDWHISMNLFFKICYGGGLLQSLVYSRNPFLEYIGNTVEPTGMFYPVPIKE